MRLMGREIEQRDGEAVDLYRFDRRGYVFAVHAQVSGKKPEPFGGVLELQVLINAEIHFVVADNGEAKRNIGFLGNCFHCLNVIRPCST